MELLKLNGSGIKIKTKKRSFVVDPDANPENDVVLLTTSSADSPLEASEEIVINGAGEYEIEGVSIKGENFGADVAYVILEDNQRVLVFPSRITKQIKDMDDFNAIVVKATEVLDEAFVSTFSSTTPVLFGEAKYIDSVQNAKKLSRINLSKPEEVEESVILLAK